MMVRGRMDAEWDHTSCLLALIANVNRGKNTSPFKPWQFHPSGRRRGGKEPKISAGEFIDRLASGVRP